jgi:hypothetical protein
MADSNAPRTETTGPTSAGPEARLAELGITLPPAPKRRTCPLSGRAT